MILMKIRFELDFLERTRTYSTVEGASHSRMGKTPLSELCAVIHNEPLDASVELNRGVSKYGVRDNSAEFGQL